MQVRLLGEVAIGTDAGWVTVAPRARRTLAALGLASGWVPAEHLAEQVWEAELPPTWRVALRGVMAELREAAGDPAIVETGAAGYQLGPKVERDVEVLRRDVATATELLEQGRDRSLLDLLRPYVGLNGDRLAPGIQAAWLATGRADVDELGLRVAELVTSAASRQGRHADAVAVARQAVAAHPLVERSHRALLRALAAAADRSAAVVAFDHCRTVLADELGVDPSDETVAVYLESLGGGDGAARARVPVSDTSFVGREPDLGEVTDLVAEPGLATLVGRSGVGKSRLAAEVATRVAGFPGGVWWVSLATVTDDPLVAPTVALQLGLAGPGDDHAGAITAFVAPRGRSLLVLDGVDAASDGVASLVTALRDGAPQLSVLATGWRRLGLEDEQVHRVSAFSAPVDGRPETLTSSLAVRLVSERVLERGGRLVVDEDHAPALAALCRRCAGLPLALELVAALLTTLPPGDVLDQLEDVALAGDDELRQVASAGCALLADDEAAVFRRLAVLDGPASLTTIRGVVVDDDLVPPLRVVRILGELADRGLVTVRHGGPRLLYAQDDDLRRVAAERLAASGEAPATYRRLAATIRALLPDDPRSAPGLFAEQVTAVVDSVRSLLAAGVDGELDVGTALEIAFRLHRYWSTTSISEGRFWLSRLLASGDEESGAWTPYARFALGYLSYWAGDSAGAVPELEASLPALSERDPSYATRAMMFLGGALDDLDRAREAETMARRALQLAEAAPDADTTPGVSLRVGITINVAAMLAQRGDAAAVTLVAEAIALCEAEGPPEQLAVCLPAAARHCWDVGAVAEARAYLDRSWTLLGEGRRIAHADLLTVATAVALGDGDLDAAVEHGTAAEAESIGLGLDRNLPIVRALLSGALLARDDVDEAARVAADAVRSGRDLSVHYPVADALEAAAAVAERVGAPAGDVAALLTAAAGIRARGERPAPQPLRASLDALRARVGDPRSPAPDLAGACDLAERLLVADRVG
jgi:predicted ATPase/DNA-binding SARP family transcriptional activator